MTEREWEQFKELAALWPECQVPTAWLSSGPLPSTRLQDYLEAARKRWPRRWLTLLDDCLFTPFFGAPAYRGVGETDAERILSALLQAALVETP